MNKRKENPNYVHGVYYIPRKRREGKKEWKRPYAEKKRKEKETYGDHIS